MTEREWRGWGWELDQAQHEVFDDSQVFISIQTGDVLVPKLCQRWAVISVQRCTYTEKDSKTIGQVYWLGIKICPVWTEETMVCEMKHCSPGILAKSLELELQ